MKQLFSLVSTDWLLRWRVLTYAVASICGLVGMLILEGWLNMLMLLLTASPVLVAALAKLKMRK
jgi:hypothetical protein